MKKTKKRMTKQRKKIMEVLKNTDSHPTADEIYDKVKEDIPNISLGTVYRNLNVLAEMGEIMILDYGSSCSRFDGNPKNHYHFKCENCGQVFDVDLDILDNLNQKLNSSTQFEVSHHRLEFYGLCPDCKNNKNNN